MTKRTPLNGPLHPRFLPDGYVQRIMRELTAQVALKDLDYDWPSLNRLRKRRAKIMKHAEKIILKLGKRIDSRRAYNQGVVDARIARRRARHLADASRAIEDGGEDHEQG